MKRPGRKNNRPGSPPGEDAALWSHVVRSVAPIRAKRRVPDVAVEPVTADRQRPSEPRAVVARSSAKQESHPLPAAPKRPQSPVPPPLADFDRRTVRRVGSGRIEIEARLDLHGDRLDDAFHILRRFLLSCHAENKRLVLVITGKGRESDERYRSPDIVSERSRRGVLRRSVPAWLDGPDLRPIVVGYIEAGPRHGGAGALYVRLRKPGGMNS